ncbi:unnamed protein product [Medioppia subpectinata]|uniref:Uncharacterized protein n=1 Tax=Medioppia subpectinata TaxID=1979941 RepID=A0A7R9KD63_9ACAR|nr:unnamed protein product [Medioppia subpectinata]CAG2101086.1 unnamed protein product [Medioppia subpectinata]
MPNYSEYELVLYVQNDRNIQQSSDEKIEVKCWPRNVLLRGVMGSEGNRTHNSTTKLSAKSLYGVYGMDGATHIQVHQMRSHHLTLSHVTDSLECRLDVMRGRIPFLKPIEGFVDLGQDVTLLIRIKEIDGIDSMVSRCYAHEGSHAVIQELTNTDGGIGFSPSLHRIKRESSHRKQRNAKRAIIMERELTANNNNEHNDWDSLLSLISLTNALPVRHDRHSIHNESHKTIKTIKPKHQIYMKQLDEQCLTPLLLIALSALTVIGLLCALTITCYHCYRNTISNSNPHKLLQSHNYAYDMNSKHNQCLQPIPLAPLPHLSI